MQQKLVLSVGNWQWLWDLVDVAALALKLGIDPTCFHAIICINHSSQGPVTAGGIFCSRFMIVCFSLALFHWELCGGCFQAGNKFMC